MTDLSITTSESFLGALANNNYMVEFLPYIFQDLWSIGGNPGVAIDLVKWNIPITHEFNIIELGCGKGATVAAMAERLSGQYVGVDIVAKFIAEGIEKIKNKNFFSSVQLEVGDMRDTLNNGQQYDIVIYGYDAVCLGSVSESIQAIDRIKKRGGYILFETTFKNPPYKGAEYLSKAELYKQINDTGLEVLDFEIWDRKRQSADRKINNHLIKERLEQLKNRRPKLKELFDEYYFDLVKRSKVLNTYIDCVTFLLR